MMSKLLKEESYGARGLWFVQTTIANLEAFDQGMASATWSVDKEKSSLSGFPRATSKGILTFSLDDWSCDSPG